MPVRHVPLAVLVAALWGINFVAIDISLETYPPLLLAAIRFGLLAVPTVLFIPRPQVKWRWLLGYGAGFGVLQFGFLYWGMSVGMPAGLASLVLQASAPFTVILGALFFKESITLFRAVGIVIAIAGLSLVGWQRAEHATFLPFLLTLIGALGWAIGNICNRQARTTEPFRLMLWMTVIPPIPMFVLSWICEGPQRIANALRVAVTPEGIGPTLGLLFTVIVATVIASGIWTWLMSRHPAGSVAPFSLLVPIFGMPTAWLIFHEVVRIGEVTGAALVVTGVLLSALTYRPMRRTATLSRDAERVKDLDRATLESGSQSK
ncbi:EamA family transporter [Devriesea agamarum]|uniref:EamA family transporter n=1 Tax=Devriesea agamarum TaxID=472569 RepID=UPI00071E3A7E|nr:EamA family transporter [Devriesea agamarum]